MSLITDNLLGLLQRQHKNQMFWIGLIVGLFVGANVGAVLAGMLFTAKAGYHIHAKAEKADSLDAFTGNNVETDRESQQRTGNSGKVEQKSSNKSIS